MQLLDFFAAHPFVGALGTVASVVSLVLGVYFFLASRRYPELTVAVEPARMRLVSGGHSSAIRVFAAGAEITSDVTAAQVSIWNRGTEAVREADILEPIALKLEAPAQILEAQLTRVARAVCGLALNTEHQAEGRISLAFKILEPGDGATVQVVYAGPPDAAIHAAGAVVGQKELAAAWRPRVYTPERRPTRGSFIEMAVMFGAMGGGALAAAFQVAANAHYSSWERHGGVVLLVGLAWLFVHVAIDALRNALRMAKPPF